MYDDPMREQMRQANRIARLQAMTGQSPMGMPGMAHPAPAAEPAQQPFDFSRNILGAAGGQLGWMGGAHLAAKLGLAAASAVPGPVGIGAKAASFGLPLIGMLAGSTAAPAAIDAVSPNIHEGVNSAFRKVGPAGLLGGGALAAYMAYKNRKGLGSAGDDIVNALTRKPMTPQQIHTPIMNDGIGVPSHAPMMSHAADQVLMHGRNPASPVMLHPPVTPVTPPPSMASAAGHVMADIVADPLMASQPVPMAASIVKHVIPHSVQTSHLGSPPKFSQPLTMNMPVHPDNRVGLKKNSRASRQKKTPQ